MFRIIRDAFLKKESLDLGDLDADGGCPPPETTDMVEWSKINIEMIENVTSRNWYTTTTNSSDEEDDGEDKEEEVDDDIIQDNVGAIHDTPYTEVLQYVIESATKKSW